MECNASERVDIAVTARYLILIIVADQFRGYPAQSTTEITTRGNNRRQPIVRETDFVTPIYENIILPLLSAHSTAKT